VNRRVWLVVWIVFALLLGGCARTKSEPVPAGEASGAEAAMPAEPERAGETEPAQPTLPAASEVILMDGELVSTYPSLGLAFPGSADGELLNLYVEVGQRVRKGDLLASLDDAELRKAVAEAQLDLDRAIEDRDKGKADIDKTYQRELDDAQLQYDRAVHDAERKYERELDDAQRALEQARRDLQRLQMQPPTTALAEAKADLGRAMDREADAADAYKQALDRPWENQDMRDALYKDWQASIVDRDLAQLRLEDAQIALQVHQLDVQARQSDVENAARDVQRVEKDPVDRDIVEREVNLALDRAVEDARHKLAEAQADLENARLYAPRDGLVLSLEAGVGSTVGTGKAIVTLLNIEEIYFITQNLSERHIAQLRRGQHAEITLRTYPDVVLSGTVHVVLPQIERASDSEARFVAYIRLDGSELDLLPGMTGRVEVITNDT
jgi:multidrug efflux pump subunit AcrA (membrane-fusion protein)